MEEEEAGADREAEVTATTEADKPDDGESFGFFLGGLGAEEEVKEEDEEEDEMGSLRLIPISLSPLEAAFLVGFGRAEEGGVEERERGWEDAAAEEDFVEARLTGET